MKDLLIEIGTEELPHSSVDPILEHLSSSFSKILGTERMETFATPRRVVFFVREYENSELVKEEVVYGPPWKSAFDDGGNPTKALEGFLKKHSARREDIFKAVRGKGEYVALKIRESSGSRLDLLKERFEEILISVPLPKRMRWTSSRKITFSRPVRWILALYGEDVIDLAFGEVVAGRKTFGHRFLSPGPFEVKDPAHYFKVMKESFVMLNRKERRETILKQINEVASAEGGAPVYPDGLLEEVADLVEYPFPVVGSFEEKFLQLPEKVIVTVLAHHQRFFCIEKGGKTTGRFIGISNNRPSDGRIRGGYEKVIKARLEDALFFFREDLKRSLGERVPELSGVLIHPKVGTLLDKTRRLIRIVFYLAENLGMGEMEDKAKRAGELSKADLLTEMVKEFDELQGYMGMVYALKGGEDPEVAKALYEQYLPSSADDPLPETDLGSLLSLADKLHDIIYFINAGEVPTGASDPYGLRRCAHGTFRILDKNRWNIDIKDLMKTLGVIEGEEGVSDFLAQRLESYLEDMGHDAVRSVLGVVSPLKPYEVIKKSRQIAELKHSDNFMPLYEAYRRIVKIIPEGWEQSAVSEDLLSEDAEKELWERVRRLEESPPSEPSELSVLINPVNKLFDEVLIMAKDERIRENRLALLLRTKRVFNRFADFSLLVPQEVK